MSEPVVCQVPAAVPMTTVWLGLPLAGLLLLKPNRQWQTGLVFLPLASVYALVAGFQRFGVSNFYVPAEASARYGDLYRWAAYSLTYGDLYWSVGCGLAALWLLLPFLNERSRMGSFVAMLLIGVIACGVTLALAWSDDSIGPLAMAPVVLVIVVHFLLYASGLSLAALACGSRCGRVRFVLWLGTWLLVICFIAVAAVEGLSSGMPPDFTWVLCRLAGVAVLLLLPFVALSFMNAFHRRRLEAAFRLPIQV